MSSGVGAHRLRFGALGVGSRRPSLGPQPPCSALHAASAVGRAGAHRVVVKGSSQVHRSHTPRARRRSRHSRAPLMLLISAGQRQQRPKRSRCSQSFGGGRLISSMHQINGLGVVPNDSHVCAKLAWALPLEPVCFAAAMGGPDDRALRVARAPSRQPSFVVAPRTWAPSQRLCTGALTSMLALRRSAKR